MVAIETAKTATEIPATARFLPIFQLVLKLVVEIRVLRSAAGCNHLLQSPAAITCCNRLLQPAAIWCNFFYLAEKWFRILVEELKFLFLYLLQEQLTLLESSLLLHLLNFSSRNEEEEILCYHVPSFAYLIDWRHVVKRNSYFDVLVTYLPLMTSLIDSFCFSHLFKLIFV